MNPSKGEESIERQAPESTMGLEAENREMRQRLVFLDISKPEMKETLETAVDKIGAFIQCVEQITATVDNLAYFQSSILSPEMRHMADMMGAFNSSGLNSLRLAIDKAAQSGIITGDIARTLGEGHTIADPKYFIEALSKNIYTWGIYRSYDQVLIALETFKNLGYIVDLNSEDQEKYKKALAEVQIKLNEANGILSEMGITPVRINFFTRVDERMAPFVKYTSIRPEIKEFYPNSSVANESEFVLGARSWAYLNSEKKLWQGHRAELIVSK